ncbi:MAG: hypothetical protein AAF551_15450 [Bacteroidota bacterium]
MDSLVTRGIVFIIGELLALFVFWFVTKAFKKKLTISGVLRGVLERLFLFITLAAELTPAMAIFGALKIATRLSDDKEDKISNDYFLVGNLVSILLVIGYYLIPKYYF